MNRAAKQPAKTTNKQKATSPHRMPPKNAIIFMSSKVKECRFRHSYQTSVLIDLYLPVWKSEA